LISDDLFYSAVLALVGNCNELNTKLPFVGDQQQRADVFGSRSRF